MSIEEQLDEIDRVEDGLTEHQLRHMALDFAIRSTGGESEADNVVKTAGKYLAFLKGGEAK